MHLYSLHDAPPLPPGIAVRESIFGVLLGAAILFGGTSAMAWALVEGHLPPILWMPLVFLVLFSSMMVRALRATFSIDNWRLHVGESGMLVKFRTPMNHHLPRSDKVIASIPWALVESARKVSQTRMVQGKQRGRQERRIYIEFTFRSDAPELMRAIEAERNMATPPGCISGGRFLHDLAVMTDPRHLRIELRSSQSATRPSIRTLMGAVSRHVPVEDELQG